MNLVLSPLAFDLSCLSAGGVGGNMRGCRPSGTRSWSGSGPGSGAAHCGLQNAIVRT